MNGSIITCHRIAWILTHREIPVEIDHINGDRSDNRILNLRNVGRKENSRNRKNNRNSSTGFSGVYWRKKNSKYRAEITVDGKAIHLGYFDTIIDAVAERIRAIRAYGFHKNHCMR